MTNSRSLEERVTALEYAVFGPFPAPMAVMTHGATHLHTQTVANGAAIACLRVDIAALKAGLRRHEAVDQRFEGLSTQLRDLRADMDAKLERILSELRRPAS